MTVGTKEPILIPVKKLVVFPLGIVNELDLVYSPPVGFDIL